MRGETGVIPTWNSRDDEAGNCYEELDDTQEALRYYNLAKSSDTLMIDSTLSMEIERRIQELGGSESGAEAGETASE